MITNERQYRITKAQLKRFEDNLATHDARTPSADIDPRIHQAMRDALASEADELRAQLEHYEQLRDGTITGREQRDKKPQAVNGATPRPSPHRGHGSQRIRRDVLRDVRTRRRDDAGDRVA